MAENKTQPTASSVQGFIAGIADAARREDCTRLLALMAAATGQPAVLWGTAIVGFGTHRYALAGGKQGQICAVGFAARSSDIVLYGVAGEERRAELAPRLSALGRHKLGKGCLYLRRLDDVALPVLQQLVAEAFLARHAS